MTYIADDVLFERLNQKEEYLSVVFDALEAKASYLLTFIAILAGLPAVLSDKTSVYWGNWRFLGSIVLVAAILFAALAAAAALWVLRSETYRVEDTGGLIAWRDSYVTSHGSFTDQQLSNSIRGAFVGAMASRIEHNEELIAEKLWRLKAAYYATTISATANLILLIPIGVHSL